jgi:hypothetical protein
MLEWNRFDFLQRRGVLQSNGLGCLGTWAVVAVTALTSDCNTIKFVSLCLGLCISTSGKPCVSALVESEALWVRVGKSSHQPEAQ